MKLLTSTGWKSLNEAHDDMTSYYDGARGGGGGGGASMKGKIGSSWMMPGKNAKRPTGSGNRPMKGDPTIHTDGIRISNEHLPSYKRAGWIVKPVKEEIEQVIDYEAFLEHVVMNYPELVEEFLNKDDE